jgi:Fe-S cluster biogenesis protein NfuA
VTNPETDPHEVGRLIEELLSDCAAHADPAVSETAEELARLLMGMYGAGLERVVTLLAGAGPEGAGLLAELAGDDLVGSLLVLHDLHPEDTQARVHRALESVRPYLGSHAGDVELLGVVDGPDGPVVRLALRGSCDGCPSSAATVTGAIEKAIEELCPEVARVDVDGLTPAPSSRDLPLLQIGLHPPEPDPPPTAWVVLDPPPLRPGQCAQLDVAGVPVLLLRPAGSHDTGSDGLPLAYADACPSCHRPLDGAALLADRLTCAHCAAAYDVRLAGRALDGSGRHLEPLPLVHRAGGLRLAVPRPKVGVPA